MISPIPSHPIDQGNSACIAAMGTSFRDLGCQVHFVYVTLEGLTAKQAKVMRSFWDSVSFVDASRSPRRQSRPDIWLLDDFYVNDLDAEISRILEIYEFDACIVHYVWFSRALLQIPQRTLRIVYTHDRFGGRHLEFLRQGVAPAWFYTSIDEEALGLHRADLVVAIQDSEADYFRSICDRDVLTMGVLYARRFLRPALVELGRPLRVGFLGSGNPTNVYSLEQLAAQIKQNYWLLAHVEFVIGGSICRTEFDGASLFRRVGYVDDVREFYNSIHISINPNVGGSGLKIKSVESLSYGLPLLGTKDAMLGLPVEIAEHQCDDAYQIVQCLIKLVNERCGVERLREESRRVFTRYQSMQRSAFREIISKIRSASNALES